MPTGILQNDTTCDIADPPIAAVDKQASLFMESNNTRSNGQGVTNEYTIVPGVCILPVAESAPCNPAELAEWSPVVVLRLHSPYRIRKVSYSGKKSRTPPILPSPNDVGAFVFTGGTLMFHAPEINQSMVSSDWPVETQYTYIENCPSRTIDGFVLGVPSYPMVVQQENLALAGGTGTPQFGAIAQAGQDAKVGWTLSQGLNLDYTNWTYNCQAYYPGVLFNDNLPNGGLT